MHDGNIFSNDTDRDLISRSLTQGAIVLLNLNEVDSGFKKLNLVDYPHADFHPHGLNVFKHDGKIFILVVNHRRDADSVEIFTFNRERNELVFFESVTHSLFYNLNDVVAVSTSNPSGKEFHFGFYTTNWLRYPMGTLLNLIEAITHRPWSTVVYCEGHRSFTCRDVIPSGQIQMANGIMTSADETIVYLMASTSKTLHILKRDTETNQLKSIQDVYVDSGCDNILLASPDHIYLGCHPNKFAFLKHRATGVPAPSQVIKVTKGPKTYEVHEVFHSNGEDISASSVATSYGNKLIIGAVFEDGLLICDETHGKLVGSYLSL